MTLEADFLKLQQSLAEIEGSKLPRFSFGFESSYEREVAQDEEDINFLKSIPVNEERRIIQAKLEAAISDAFNLNMHQGEIKIVRQPRPGLTVTIEVARLIQGICEYYEIPLSRS